jgi:hypothetical protein
MKTKSGKHCEFTWSLVIATLAALSSPFWYFISLKAMNGKIWVAGYVILLGLWIAQFLANIFNRKWDKRHCFFQAGIGVLCFLPFSIRAFTFLCWTIGGFAT